MKTPPPSLIAVDLLRFGCAASVVCYHYLTTRWLEPTPEAAALLRRVIPPPDQWIAAGRYGWIGVQLFFVISGMLIAQSIGQAGARAFLRRRLLRLAPGVLICAPATAAILALAGQGGSDLWLRLVGSLVFWPSGRQIDPSYWTLGVELSFYGLVAVAVRMRGPAAIERVAWLLLAWSATFWLSIVVVRDAAHPAVVPPYRDLLLFSYGSFFAVGLLFTVVARRGLDVRRAGAVAAAVATCCAQIVWKSDERALVLLLPMEAWVPVGLFLAGIAILAVAWKAQAMLARVVDPGIARRIGLATYPLYLIHQEAGTVVIAGLARLDVGTGPAIGLTALAAVVVAWIVAGRIEPVVRGQMAAALDAAGGIVAGLRGRGAGERSPGLLSAGDRGR